MKDSEISESVMSKIYILNSKMMFGYIWSQVTLTLAKMMIQSNT